MNACFTAWVAYRRTPQVRQRLDAQRRGIVHAATSLVAESGYAACSVTRVAMRAGVASGTVYNHFTGKADLLAQVFRTAATRELDAVRVACALPGTADERVSAVIETFSRRALTSPQLAYALLAEPVDPKVDELRLEFRRAFVDLVAGVIADGMAAAELPAQNAAVAASALIGAIGEVLVIPLANGAACPDVLAGLITFALRGIGACDAAHA